MGALKSGEIRSMAIDEIDGKVDALKKELLNLRVELRTGKLEKFGKIREVKKSIARLLTILGEETRKIGAKSKTEKKGPP